MNFILVFTVLYGLLPLLIYHFLNKKLIDIKAIYPFLVVVFMAGIYEFIGTFLLKIDAANWFYIYNVLAFLSIHYLFYIILKKRFKIIFISLIIILLLLIVFASFFLKSYNFLEITSFFNVFQTSIILFFSILWFKKVFQELIVDGLLKSPYFYFLSGLIIYYSGTLFLFLTITYIYLNDKPAFEYYWLLNIILNILLRTLLIVGILKARIKTI